MCVTVSVKRNGQYTDCDSVEQLARVLGLMPEQVSPDGGVFCLCNAYFDKIGAVKNPDPNEWWPEYIIDLDKGCEQ